MWATNLSCRIRPITSSSARRTKQFLSRSKITAAVHAKTRHSGALRVRERSTSRVANLNTKGEVEAPPYLKRVLEWDAQFASADAKTIEVLRNVTSLNGISGQLWLSRLGVAYRFALRLPVVDALQTGLLRPNFAWLRNRAGGRPNSRLKARLNAGSDS
jgi:hypothetical protein